MSHSAKRSGKRVPAVIVAVLVIGLALLVGAAIWRHAKQNPLSDDAAIQANVVHISPAVPGTLTDLRVQEGSRVQRGDLLFRIEADVYEQRVRQAEAELAVAEAALSTRNRTIKAETANAAIADEQIARAKVNLELAQKTLRRLQPLAGKGYVTQQQLDTATTAERDARVSLSQAQAQASAAQSLIGEVEAAEATVEVARATVAIARKALSDTEIHAPNDGLVVGLAVSAGEHLAPGQSLFTLINTEQWYAVGFFKETDLLALKVGACAMAYTMTNPDLGIEGKVVNIGWGISTEDMISLPRTMPIVQKSLNWVRVAQRFPVRIQLTSPPADLMRVGASATVVVRPDDDC